MKKIIYTLLIIFLFIPFTIFGSEKKDINIYLFYGNGCPHCRDEEAFFKEYLKEHTNVKLYKYEVWYDKENQEKLQDVINLLNVKSSGIPFLVIGNEAIIGFSEELTPERISNTINYYENISYEDKTGIYLGIVEKSDEVVIDEVKKEETIDDIVIPKSIKGIVKKAPLIISTIIIGLVDGFNPCAMWILLFLISMLLGVENKKRRWILGISFLLSSAIVYFLFLISWLNLAEYLNKISYIRISIAFVAVIFGTVSVIRFLKTKNDGCGVVNSKNRKRIITSIRKIIKEKSFILAILGIALLAAAVNIIELLCSLGLPVMFTQILSVNNISNIGKLLYSMLYVLFFLIDDIIIFVVSMKCLETKAISNKFGKYSHLIGGIIMIIIGLLMLYKPEWLMFNI